MSKVNKRHKNFGSPAREVEPEPITFDLYDEVFECYPDIQGAVLLKFVREADSGDGGRAADALLGFFSRVLVPESFERLEKMWVDPEKVISMELLGEITGWIVEQYTTRPTKRSKE